jgi:hypothetical protein
MIFRQYSSNLLYDVIGIHLDIAIIVKALENNQKINVDHSILFCLVFRRSYTAQSSRLKDYQQSAAYNDTLSVKVLPS